VQISQQVVKLIVRNLRGGHHQPAAHNHLRQPFVCRRRARGHRLELGERLQPRPVQWTLGGGVVAPGAFRMKHLRPARLFHGPHRLRF
jgi:hypothetical protein